MTKTYFFSSFFSSAAGGVLALEDEEEDGGVLEAPLDGELLLLEGGVEAGGVLIEDEELLEGGVAEVDGDFLPSSRPQAASANAAATAMRSALLMGFL